MKLSLSNLTVGYDRHPAVHHLSGAFVTGTITGIVGPNGGGKSTLLKAITGFIKPMSGHVVMDGIAPQELAYLPQQSEIDRKFPLSVAEVVDLGHWRKCGAFGRLSKAQRLETLHALAAVGMEAFAERPIAALSTGQWQRVLFARLMVQDARLLLLDEPFAAIDARTTQDLVEILRRWTVEGRTVIAVMHDLGLVKAHCAQALVLAREAIAWGDVASAMSDENLVRARNLAAGWVEHAEACHIKDAA